MKPVCVKCQRFYRAKKNGYWFIEAMPARGIVQPRPGNAHPEEWSPYKLWVGDLWECRGCGSQIIVGVGNAALAHHFQADFGKFAEQSQMTVNDC